MFLATVRNLALISLLLPSARLFAQAHQSFGDDWLKEYNECQDYGEVYVVKKITKACRSYQTFLTDKNGRKLTPAYRDIGDFEEGLAEFVPMQLSQQGHGLHGFIDKQGKIIIEPKYTPPTGFAKAKLGSSTPPTLTTDFPTLIGPEKRCIRSLSNTIQKTI